MEEDETAAEFTRAGELHAPAAPPPPPLPSMAPLAMPPPPAPPPPPPSLDGLLDDGFAVAAAAAAASASSVELWRFPLAALGFAALAGRRAIGFAIVRRVCGRQDVVTTVLVVVSVK